jgi:hypothetical protein
MAFADEVAAARLRGLIYGLFWGVIVLLGLLFLSSTIKTGPGELPPPQPVVKDILQIIVGDGYDLMTIDPDTKVVIVRHRWFEKIIADVPAEGHPWAEIKTRDRGGKGNTLHIHTPKEIGVGRIDGKYPIQLKVLDAEK